MARLIYSTTTSLDGYVADPGGNFDWTAPDEEVHAFVNDLLRPAGTHLYGRRMYEVMRVWETLDPLATESAGMRDFARIWEGVDKVVYSSTLPAVSTARTRLERSFDPEAVRRMKAEASRDLVIGGPTLAARAIEAGLVDEFHQFVVPLVLGGGTSWLPTGVRVDLDLQDVRRFGGVVYLHYRPRDRSAA